MDNRLLNRIIQESIYRLLQEDGEDQIPAENQGAGEAVDAADVNHGTDTEYIIPAYDSQYSTAQQKRVKILQELNKLVNYARECNCSLTYTEERDDNGFVFKVRCTVATFKKKATLYYSASPNGYVGHPFPLGEVPEEYQRAQEFSEVPRCTPNSPRYIRVTKEYQFVGEVCPIDETGTEGETTAEGNGFAMVTPCAEFAQDDNIIQQLENTGIREKCPACGKASRRTHVYAFIDDAGKLYKFGGTCAALAFGMDVSTKINKIVKMLARLGSRQYLEHSDMILSDLITDNKPLFASLMFITINGIPDAVIDVSYSGYKDSVTDNNARGLYQQILGETRTYFYHKANANNNQEQYEQWLAQAQQRFPEFYQNIDNVENLRAQFLSGIRSYIDFFDSVIEHQDKNQEAMLNVAKIFCGGKATQKNEKILGKSERLIPILVQKFFIHSTRTEFDMREGFEGEQTLHLTISDIYQHRDFAARESWLNVYAKDENGDMFAWNALGEFNHNKGEEVTLNATCQYVSDDNVVWLENVNIEGDAAEEQPEEEPTNVLQANVDSELDLSVTITSYGNIVDIQGRQCREVFGKTSNNELVYWLVGEGRQSNWALNQQYNITGTYTGRFHRENNQVAFLKGVRLQGQAAPVWRGGAGNGQNQSYPCHYDNAIPQGTGATNNGKTYVIFAAQDRGFTRRIAVFLPRTAGAIDMNRRYTIDGRKQTFQLHTMTVVYATNIQPLNESKSSRKPRITESMLKKIIIESIKRNLKSIL